MAKKQYLTPESLPAKMAGRYATLLPVYKNRSFELFTGLTTRGRNSYESVSVRSETVHNSKGKERDYNRSLTNAFVANQKYDSHSIANIVCSVRSAHGFDRFKGNIPKQCIEELHKLFLVEEIMEPKPDGKKHRLYIPKFPLLVE